MCLMAFVNTTYLDDYITFCATVLHSKLIYFFINIYLFQYNLNDVHIFFCI